MEKRIKFDELHDLFQNRKNCYFVCCDIKNMISMNEISRNTGDLAIIETMQRMRNAAGEEEILFRIGGDEFALLTASEDAEYAGKIVRDIPAHNGECIEYENQKIPLHLYGAVFRPREKERSHSELFTDLQTTLRDAKR